MADKLTQQITEALTRVAANPGGLPLYSSKADPGLFPNTAGAKPAAQKCLADELIRVSGTDTKGKTPRDLYSLTEKGWEFLLAAVNPKQVLEDFVRALEARQGEVGELLDTARRMADSLQGLKEAVTRVLPGVSEAKMERPTQSSGVRSQESGDRSQPERAASSLTPDSCLLTPAFPSTNGRGSRGVGSSDLALLDASPTTDLVPSIVAHLAGQCGPTDCTLPELFRAITFTDTATIGEFHDCLRQMHADGEIALHSWTGPLYELPEPQFALLIGHGIAYYASLRG